MSDTVPRRIVVASPVEPSGSSWILNCLLELGVRVEHGPAASRLYRRRARQGQASIWQRDGDLWRLEPRAREMGKWMPALLEREAFRFREDVWVDYVQDWPREAHRGAMAAVFLRDPRDALYSAWRHREASLDYPGWVALPNPVTLLDAAANWRFYAECWMALAGERVFLFEEYKRDDRALLAKAADLMGIDAGAEKIEAAAAASTFERAKAGEAKYRAEHPGDRRVANRAGRVGDWRDRAELAGAVAEIERVTAPVLARLGYDAPDRGPAPAVPGPALARFLPALGEILAPGVAEGDPLGDPRVPALVAALGALDAEVLKAAALPPVEARMLVESLRRFVEGYGAEAGRRLDRLGEAFSEGSQHHAETLMRLLRQRRKAQN